MTDLKRELEIAQWLMDTIQPKDLMNHLKPLEKWGLGEIPYAGILIGIRSLAEAERHNEEVEKRLKEILDCLTAIHLLLPTLRPSSIAWSSIP